MQLYNNLTKVKQLVRNLETHLMCPMLHLTWDLVCTNPGRMFAVTYAFT